MYHPFDSKNKIIMFKPQFNLPTYYDSRDSNNYKHCNFLSNKKRKLIINNYSYQTNGNGIKLLPNHNHLHVNHNTHIKIGNIIYIIPPRFCKFLHIIKTLLQNPKNKLREILKFLENYFDIDDKLLTNIQPSAIKKQYKYTLYDKPYITYNNVANFYTSFKMGKNLDENSIGLDTLIGNLNIQTPFYPLVNNIQFVYIANNDGKTFTSNINDIQPMNLFTSFWATKLSVNGNPIVNDSSVFKIIVSIFPIIDIYNIKFGILSILENRLVFVPIVTNKYSFLQNNPYQENMLFNIKILVNFDDFLVKYNTFKSGINFSGLCKYNNFYNLFRNNDIE
jgi:hypothetical protein